MGKRKVLVLGGTNYFGKILVSKLIESGELVTLATRGLSKDSFGDSVSRIVLDRNDLKDELKDLEFDLVYDQICFTPEAATALLEVIKAPRIIFTSSQSVYAPGNNLKEEQLEYPSTDDPRLSNSTGLDYGTCKLLAEVAYLKSDKCKISSVRLPIVIDPADQTGRFQFHLDRIINKRPLFFPNIEASLSMVTAEHAAEGLYKLGKISHSGPINVATGEIKLKSFLELVVSIKDGEFIPASEEGEEQNSPYGIPSDWWMNLDNCKRLNLLEEVSLTSILKRMINSYE
ncbi:MAG: hypothetical protein HN509_16410 [Halobacteriovoraceae bacterium]|jgi:nucleoside-diphosphate-sugar epimerase|nr:hypothetical protein [Halobacteriovoraceae bacterium]MBT5093940.1 hypothetical protein [Halobacteriovoraceae bacterium]